MHVDSRDRDYDRYPEAGTYVIELPRTYHGVVEARLLHAELPSSFYVFQQARANTTVRVRVDGVQRDLTIPDGNYTAFSMSDALKAALDDAFAPKTFDVTASETTLRLALRCTSHPAAAVEVDTTVHASDRRTNWGLGYYLGFDKGAVLAGVGGVASPNVVSTNPETSLYLSLGDLDASEYAFFARIPVDTASFGYAFYATTAKGTPAVAFDPPVEKLKKLAVAFAFHDGTPVRFNDVEHSFTLALRTRATHPLRHRHPPPPPPPPEPEPQPQPPPPPRPQPVATAAAAGAAAAGWWTPGRTTTVAALALAGVAGYAYYARAKR